MSDRGHTGVQQWCAPSKGIKKAIWPRGLVVSANENQIDASEAKKSTSAEDAPDIVYHLEGTSLLMEVSDEVCHVVLLSR